MEFCAVFKPTEPIRPNIIRYASLAEQSGFKYVGVLDDHLLLEGRRREVYVTLSAIALSTKRVKIGPWVTNPFTRHPTTTAFSVATLNELSGGRAVLGFGLGGPQARRIGSGQTMLHDRDEAVSMIRTLFSGGIVEVNAWKYRLPKPTPTIPIYWAAHSSPSFRFGGRIADGVIMSSWLDEGMLRSALKEIDKGAQESGRTADQIPIFFGTASSISIDSDKAIRDVTPYVTTLLATPISSNLPGWGMERVKEIRKVLDWHKHLEPNEVVDKLVPKEMLLKKAIAGTPEDCIKSIRLLERHGIKRISIIIQGEDVEGTLRHYKDTIIPEYNR